MIICKALFLDDIDRKTSNTQMRVNARTYLINNHIDECQFWPSIEVPFSLIISTSEVF
jgi:hypothetical protein